MANTAKFTDIRKDLIIDLMPVIGKYYGNSLSLETGYNACSESAYQIDRIVAKITAELEEAEKNSVKNQVANK